MGTIRGRHGLLIAVLVPMTACSELESPEGEQQLLVPPQPVLTEGCRCSVVMGTGVYAGFADKNPDDGTWTIGFFAGPDGDFSVASVIDNNDDPWADDETRCGFLCSEVSKLLWLNKRYGFIDAEDGSHDTDHESPVPDTDG